MAALPLFHSFANIGIQSVALRNHNAMALVPNPRDLDDLLATIAETRPTAFGVPTLFNALLHHPSARRQGRPQLRQGLLLGGGAAAGRDQAPLRGADRRPHRRGLLAHRGHAGLRRQPGGGPNKIGSVGMPLPDVEMRIVDPDSGAQLPTGRSARC